jgi:mRNA-degrading endonuclease YafQ of YafQ-DinJ toxin-antitoxin module
MKYRRTATFNRDFDRLPTDIQKRAIESFKQFKENPQHPSLRVHKLQGKRGVWAGHVTLAYVFTFRKIKTDDETEYEFLNIGTHEIYDK